MSRRQPTGTTGRLAGDAVAGGEGKIKRGIYGLGGFSLKENGGWRVAPVFLFEGGKLYRISVDQR